MKKNSSTRSFLIASSIVWSLILGGALAFLFSRGVSFKEDFDRLLVRDAVIEEMTDGDDWIFQESFLQTLHVETLAALSRTAGDQRRLALAQAAVQYPEQTEFVCSHIGSMPIVGELVAVYGSMVIPVLAYEYRAQLDLFNQTESAAQNAWQATIKAYNATKAQAKEFIAEKGWSELLNVSDSTEESPVEVEKNTEDWVKSELKTKAPEIFDNGVKSMLVAAVKIHRLGPGFLRRYTVLPDGKVKRIWSTTTTSVAENFMLAGIVTMETKIARGEELSGADKLNAALDTAGILAVPLVSFKWFSKAGKTADTVNDARKVARGADAVGDAGKTGRLLSITTRIPEALKGKILTYGAVGFVGYTAWNHPKATMKSIMWIGEKLGIGGPLFLFCVLSVAVLFLIWFLVILWRPIFFTAYNIVRLLRVVAAVLEKVFKNAYKKPRAGTPYPPPHSSPLPCSDIPSPRSSSNFSRL